MRTGSRSVPTCFSLDFIVCFASAVESAYCDTGVAFPWLQGMGIAMSVLIATMVSTYSEHKNETSFQTLQEQV